MAPKKMNPAAGGSADGARECVKPAADVPEDTSSPVCLQVAHLNRRFSRAPRVWWWIMTAQIAAYGRLSGDPQQRTSSSGKVWATASIAVNAGRDTDGPPLWVQVVAFGSVAEVLCRHEKGDLLSVSGRLQ
jgi:hypothetical protein